MGRAGHLRVGPDAPFTASSSGCEAGGPGLLGNSRDSCAKKARALGPLRRRDPHAVPQLPARRVAAPAPAEGRGTAEASRPQARSGLATRHSEQESLLFSRRRFLGFCSGGLSCRRGCGRVRRERARAIAVAGAPRRPRLRGDTQHLPDRGEGRYNEHAGQRDQGTGFSLRGTETPARRPSAARSSPSSPSSARRGAAARGSRPSQQALPAPEPFTVPHRPARRRRLHGAALTVTNFPASNLDEERPEWTPLRPTQPRPFARPDFRRHSTGSRPLPRRCVLRRAYPANGGRTVRPRRKSHRGDPLEKCTIPADGSAQSGGLPTIVNRANSMPNWLAARRLRRDLRHRHLGAGDRRVHAGRPSCS